jgi:hypothetical protein
MRRGFRMDGCQVRLHKRWTDAAAAAVHGDVCGRQATKDSSKVVHTLENCPKTTHLKKIETQNYKVRFSSEVTSG